MQTKQLSLLIFLIFVTQAIASSDIVSSEVPSRLEAGYGSDEMLSETLPYIPNVSEKEKVKFVGDLRLRSQSIATNNPSKKGQENVLRYRARVGLNAVINEQLQFEMMLASGDGDPVSTNQSMGDSFVGKNLVLDVADAFYEYDYHSFVRGGKMKLPFYRTDKNQMIWDNDLRPEGVFVKHKLFKDTDITAGAFMVRNANETVDKDKGVGLYTLQAIEFVGDFRFGASLFIYDSLKGEDSNVSYNRGAARNLSKGNSVDANGHYLYDYHLAEAFIQYKINDDVRLGADGVYNMGAPKENLAYNISLMYGDLKKNGDIKFGYYYRYTEKDAVLGMFSDSDFNGGRTDSKGHQVMGGYQLMKNTQAAFTYINGTINESFGIEYFQRLHIDIKLKF